MSLGKAWFKPKTYGFGATPTTWEGWVVIFAAAAIMIGAFRFHDWRRALIMGVSIFVVAAIAYAKTDGDWRWRWGKD